MGKKPRRKIIFPASFARRSALPFLKKAFGTWKQRGHQDGWMDGWMDGCGFWALEEWCFSLCFTFQVRASSSCNRSRRAAKAAAKAFEGVGVVGLFNGYVDWYHLAFFVGWFLHFGKINRRWPKTIRCRFWTSSWNLRADDFRIDLGSIPWDPKGVNTKGCEFTLTMRPAFSLRDKRKDQFFWGLYVFTLKAPCVDSYIPQCGGCVHSWKLRQILSQSSNPRGEHHSWSMKVKRKIGRWAWSEHAMIRLPGKEDELCANHSLIFG